MTKEIITAYETGKTLWAKLLLDATMWDGLAMVDPTTLSTAEWKAGLVFCTEGQTTDSAGLSDYTADWPGALSLLAEYTVIFVESAAPETRPEPTAVPKARQENPTEYHIVGAMTQAALAQFVADDTGEATAASGSVAKIAQGAGNIGSGALVVTITVKTAGGDPLDGVEVWITSDSAGDNVVAGTVCTDAAGLATFMLDAGTYFVWKQLAGFDFTNPIQIVVSA